jgi:hypothetical protein
MTCKLLFKFSREETETEIRDRDRDRDRRRKRFIKCMKRHKEEPKKTKQVINKTSSGMQTIIQYTT